MEDDLHTNAIQQSLPDNTSTSLKASPKAVEVNWLNCLPLFK